MHQCRGAVASSRQARQAPAPQQTRQDVCGSIVSGCWGQHRPALCWPTLRSKQLTLQARPRSQADRAGIQRRANGPRAWSTSCMTPCCRTSFIGHGDKGYSSKRSMARPGSNLGAMLARLDEQAREGLEIVQIDQHLAVLSHHARATKRRSLPEIKERQLLQVLQAHAVRAAQWVHRYPEIRGLHRSVVLWCCTGGYGCCTWRVARLFFSRKKRSPCHTVRHRVMKVRVITSAKETQVVRTPGVEPGPAPYKEAALTVELRPRRAQPSAPSAWGELFGKRLA